MPGMILTIVSTWLLFWIVGVFMYSIYEYVFWIQMEWLEFPINFIIYNILQISYTSVNGVTNFIFYFNFK